MADAAVVVHRIQQHEVGNLIAFVDVGGDFVDAVWRGAVGTRALQVASDGVAEVDAAPGRPVAYLVANAVGSNAPLELCAEVAPGTVEHLARERG